MPSGGELICEEARVQHVLIDGIKWMWGKPDRQDEYRSGQAVGPHLWTHHSCFQDSAQVFKSEFNIDRFLFDPKLCNQKVLIESKYAQRVSCESCCFLVTEDRRCEVTVWSRGARVAPIINWWSWITYRSPGNHLPLQKTKKYFWAALKLWFLHILLHLFFNLFWTFGVELSSFNFLWRM